jgi:hypothetical protein
MSAARAGQASDNSQRLAKAARLDRSRFIGQAIVPSAFRPSPFVTAPALRRDATTLASIELLPSLIANHSQLEADPQRPPLKDIDE